MQELRYINLDAFCPCLRLNCKGMIRFSVMKTGIGVRWVNES